MLRKRGLGGRQRLHWGLVGDDRLVRRGLHTEDAIRVHQVPLDETRLGRRRSLRSVHAVRVQVPFDEARLGRRRGLRSKRRRLIYSLWYPCEAK